MKHVRTFKWSTIEQPGEYFRVFGDMLIEEKDGYYVHWLITHDDGQRVTVTYDHTEQWQS